MSTVAATSTVFKHGRSHVVYIPVRVARAAGLRKGTSLYCRREHGGLTYYLQPQPDAEVCQVYTIMSAHTKKGHSEYFVVVVPFTMRDVVKAGDSVIVVFDGEKIHVFPVQTAVAKTLSSPASPQAVETA